MNKEPVTETIYLQFSEKEVDLSDVKKKIRADYESAKEGEDKPKDIKIYLKPSDSKAYYVINGDYAGEVEL